MDNIVEGSDWWAVSVVVSNSCVRPGVGIRGDRSPFLDPLSVT